MISLGRGRIFLIFKEEALCLIRLVRALQLNEPTGTGTAAKDVKHRTFKTCDVAPIGTADPEPELLSGADKRHFWESAIFSVSLLLESRDQIFLLHANESAV